MAELREDGGWWYVVAALEVDDGHTPDVDTFEWCSFLVTAGRNTVYVLRSPDPIPGAREIRNTQVNQALKSAGYDTLPFARNGGR